MASRIAGVCYITADGTSYNVSGNVTMNMTESNRTSLIGSTGVAGYSEELVVPFIEGDVLLERDFPIEKLRTAESMTVTAELANGMNYTLSEAHLAGETNINATDGNVTLRFEGKKGVWG